MPEKFTDRFTIGDALALTPENVRPRAAGWLHVSCILFSDAKGVSYFPWRRLAAALELWRSDRRFRQFFFMRKPPGLRLRFYGNELAELLEPELVTWLQAAEESNDIRGFRFGIYEPETARFGGPAGMAVAHEQFDRDSRTASRYEMLGELERRGLPKDLFSLFLINDLCARSLDDKAEIWDVWQKLGRLVRGSVRTSVVSETECNRVRDVVTLEATFTSGLSSSAAALLEQASADNAHVAQRLRALASSGRLHIGLRSWLATAAVFHWNRLGLTDVEIGAMTATMNCLLNPDENET